MESNQSIPEVCTCEWITRDLARLMGKSERTKVCPMHRHIFGMPPEDSAPLPHVTTPDGRHWSAQGVAEVVATLDSVLKQRDRIQLELDLLRGRIHTLDLEQRGA